MRSGFTALDRVSQACSACPSSFPESAEASAACAPFPLASTASSLPPRAFHELRPPWRCRSCASSQARSRPAGRSAPQSVPPVRPGSALARSTSVAGRAGRLPSFRRFPRPSRRGDSNSQRSRAFWRRRTRYRRGGFSSSPAEREWGPLCLVGSPANGAVPVGKKPTSFDHPARLSLGADAEAVLVALRTRAIPTAPSSARITSQSTSRWNALRPLSRRLLQPWRQYADEGDVCGTFVVDVPDRNPRRSESSNSSKAPR